MGLLDKIEALEKEIETMPRNRTTYDKICLLKAKLSRMRTDHIKTLKLGLGTTTIDPLALPRISIVGMSKSGKTALFEQLTQDSSGSLGEFGYNNMKCPAKVISRENARFRLVDLPALEPGCSMKEGVLRDAVEATRLSDMVIMVLDVESAEEQKAVLVKELENVGLRLNAQKPQITIIEERGGGIVIKTSTKLTKMEDRQIKQVMGEFNIHSGYAMFKGDYSIEELIDALEGTRKYLNCIFVYNKCDKVSMEEVSARAS